MVGQAEVGKSVSVCPPPKSSFQEGGLIGNE